MEPAARTRETGMTEATQDNPRTPRPWVVELLARLLTFFTVAVATCVVLAAGALLTSREARAETPETKSGALFFKADAGETLTAPLLATDVRIKVSGMVARAEVTQTFRNPTDDWLEGVYVF